MIERGILSPDATSREEENIERSLRPLQFDDFVGQDKY